MKTIGLIGGTSWESTIPYYRQINEAVKARLGGLHSAKLILHSVDFGVVEKMMREGDWDAAGAHLAQAAVSLEAAGADFVVMCTNTLHKVAPTVEAAVTIPLLHIIDPTATAIKARAFQRIGLLGTRFTMEQAFFRDRLAGHGLEVLIPNEADRNIVHRVIFEELCLGQVRAESRADYVRIIDNLVTQGAQAIVLGCTEIAMLVGAEDTAVPLFDTAALHAEAAVEAALADL